MIVKLAQFIVETPKDDQPKSVRGNNVLIGNYAHPAVIGGGILGGWGANEVLDKLMPKTQEVVLTKTKRKLFGIPFGSKITGGTIVTKGGGSKRNLLWNIARGGMSAIGAGSAAYLVNKHRKDANDVS